MNANTYEYRENEYDDHSDNESFQSALCEMYNDVLYHAVIPEEQAVYFADAFGGDEPSYAVNRSRPCLLGKHSFASCRSTTGSSTASSYLLSVGETDDDDLSYMTEGTFDGGFISTPSIELPENFSAIQISEGISSTEPSEFGLSTIGTSRETDQDTHAKELNIISPDKTAKMSNVANMAYKNNILGHKDYTIRRSSNHSDSDAGLSPPSSQSPYPECSSTYDCSEMSDITHL